MSAPTRIAVAGLGAIGGSVARAIAGGRVPGAVLVAASARDRARASKSLAAMGAPDAALVDPGDLAELAEIVVECLPAAAFEAVAEPAVERGRELVVATASRLLDRGDLIDRAAETGARIRVPTGALVGLDAVRAACVDEAAEVRIISSKPPRAFAGVAHIAEQGIDLDAVDAPLCLYAGPVREGARLFPANVNVAAALSLAAHGPDRTIQEVWADPGLTRNRHRVVVRSRLADIDAAIENLPDPDNPRTSAITAHSIVALLRRHGAALTVGS
ncbi:MAG: aspartate dehydrogenase [Azospirillaceae bacterium]